MRGEAECHEIIAQLRKCECPCAECGHAFILADELEARLKPQVTDKMVLAGALAYHRARTEDWTEYSWDELSDKSIAYRLKWSRLVLQAALEVQGE